MYIYKITDNRNGKSYIGQCAKPISETKKYYGSGKIITNIIKKYGSSILSKEILCECNTKDELNDMEKYYIKKYNTIIPNGYNISTGGNGGDLGSEVNDKIALTVSKRWKEGLYDHIDFSKINKGKVMSDEVKKKISESQLGENGYWFGKNLSDEHKKSIGNATKLVYEDRNGKVYQNWLNAMRSKNVREKISKTMTGRKPWNYGKKDVYSEEQIHRMSKAARNRNITEENERSRREKISKYFSENHPNKKSVYYTGTGREYDSIKHFCNETNISWYRTKKLRKEGKLIIKHENKKD
jgi:group I intron endonuclease